MFKHTVNYVDFNGTERTEDLYFHLSLPEVTRLEAEIGEPLDQYTKTLVADQNMKKLLDFLEKVLLNSYGKKTSDGRSFYKSKELRAEFEYSQAYADVFEQLLTNPELAQKFGNSVSEKRQAQKNQVAPTVVNN